MDFGSARVRAEVLRVTVDLEVEVVIHLELARRAIAHLSASSTGHGPGNHPQR